MCTVSLIPFAEGGYRLVINRDEQRHRAEAHSPRWRDHGGRRVIYPVDPVGGGTWAAATDVGLALCILNSNLIPAPPLPDPQRLVSRGHIILEALDAADADGVVAKVRRLDLEAFAPFRLLAVGLAPDVGGDARAVEVSWDRRALASRRLADGPLCLVSSGLGDALVAPRQALFAEIVSGAGRTSEAQDRFHRHTWTDRPELSVMMSRRDARTVSVLSFEVRPGRAPGSGPVVRTSYEPVPASPWVARSEGAALARSRHPE